MSITERASVCTFDCPDTCSLTVNVNDGRVVKVRGSRAAPFTDGVICSKVAQGMSDFVHGPDRLLHPLRRAGPKGSGTFQVVSWDEALDEIRDRVGKVIERRGPQAVLPLSYAGPHGMLSCDSMSARFFHKLGASLLYRRALCAAVRAEAWAGTYGAVPGVPPEFAETAALNLVWGNNATVSNLHLVRKIRSALRRGGKLVVVDPRRSKIAEQAQLHLAPLPGTDVLLGWALAVELERLGAIDQGFVAANVLGCEEFMARARDWPAERAARECGVTRQDIETCARWIAEADPLVLSMGNGLERARNGGSGIRTAIALPALVGKLGGRSGIVLGAANAFPKTMARLHRPDLAPTGTRTINILDVSRHLVNDDLDPPLRALFIYNHNPIVVHPDQNRMKRGLGREDVFMVGIDVTMTESMAQCDIVLPAATHFECDDIYTAYGHHWLQRAEPVIAPLGQSLPNTEIFRRLAARFGFDDPCFRASDRELMDDAIDPADYRLQGIRPSALPTSRAIEMTAEDGRPLVLCDTVRPATPSGKIELVSQALAERWGAAARLPTWQPVESDYPLRLVTPSSDRRISSTLGGRRAAKKLPLLTMNPVDAGKRGLQDGYRVSVSNDLGRVILTLAVSQSVPPGVVAAEKGAWLAGSPTGQTVSALASADARADLGQGACFNDTRVEVAPAD